MSNLEKFDDFKNEIIIHFRREKRKISNSVKNKLMRLETLESKLGMNKVQIGKTGFSKQSTKLEKLNFPIITHIRKDIYGNPIVKKGIQRISFSQVISEIKVFHHKLTIYEDLIRDQKKDKISKNTIKQIKNDCKCIIV